MKVYRVLNWISGDAKSITAVSTREATEVAGWKPGQCVVILERMYLPIPARPGDWL